MNIADRIAAMASDLPALTIGDLVRFGASVHGHRSSFTVDAAGKSLAVISIDPSAGSRDEQENVDRIALVLHALFSGSEARVADAELRASNLRGALQERKAEIAGLLAKLAHFEAGRSGRGDMYAIEAHSGVWLCGRPDPSALGLHFSSWGDLARAFPGLRPAGVKDGHIIMRPIGAMEPTP